MAQFRGIIKGGRGEASRLGHKTTGLSVQAQSWQGKVTVYLWHDDKTGTDMAHIGFATHGGRGQDHELYNGPVAGPDLWEDQARRYVLVYQAGIANVFQVTSFNLADYGRDAVRLLQADFRSCEMFARGLAASGGIVKTAACNQAGDIATAHWSDDLDAQPFSPLFQAVTV